MLLQAVTVGLMGFQLFITHFLASLYLETEIILPDIVDLLLVDARFIRSM